MLPIRPMAEAAAHALTASRDTIVIDLAGTTTAQEALVRIGRVLKGADSPLIAGRSLDAFQDVVSDWMLENIHHRRHVTLIHAEALRRIDKALLPEIAACLDEARALAIRHSPDAMAVKDNIVIRIFA
ncbi:hypothetical protein GCM10007301_21790 [Azorhizobium oxalatiphilum]|uniref:Barstar (barnase inhibitor) domain-containing protein n=1 Tax=Azorhizobium oxalatiphilum TaxID=980631 RepID=A0A917FCC8_9HYPH|nr:barstar family protein [Azorhizobium oxalatiphilum]GGF61734.1 hypothetical protein GCM10007301_21790 [Azorhizobium oxalatiphilum]